MSYEKPSVIESLSDLKIASILNMLSRLSIDISIIVLAIYRDISRTHIHRAFLVLLSEIISIIIFIGIVLGLIAAYAFLVPAYEGLRAFKFNVFNTTYKLIKTGYLGGFALLLIGFIFVVASTLLYRTPNAFVLGIALIVLAVVLLAIGHIGLAIGSLRLSELFGEGKFTIVAILFLVGAFIILITPLAWILKYMALKTTISKVTSGYYTEAT